MDKSALRATLKSGGGKDSTDTWYEIDIDKLKSLLSGNKLKKAKQGLEFQPHFLGGYYWIYDKNFNEWFDDVYDMIQDQQEAPTDSPIEPSDTGEKLSKVDKIYNSLLNKNSKYISLTKLAAFCGSKDNELYKKISTCGTFNDSATTLYPKKNDIIKIKGYIQQKLDNDEEYKEQLREEGRKDATEQKDKEIKELQEKHKEDIQAEREDKNNKVADMKHKKDEEIKNLQNNNNVVKTSNNSPSIKNFIKEAYINGDYKVGADELRKRYTSGKYKTMLKDANIDNVINDVMLYSTIETQKKKQKLAQLAQIGAFSPEAVANMDPNTQQEINDAIVAQSRITNAQKRLKYKLPINKPKARAAMLNQHINPMVFRGAYSTGNY